MKGKKVFLRQPTAEDFAEYVRLAKQSEKFHRGLMKMAKTREEFDAFLRRSEQETNECFLICRNEDRAIAGMINLSQIFRGSFQNAYLGYGLGVKFTGQGLITEAIKLILKYAFTDLRLHRVEANVQPHNTTSIAVLQKTNFTKEGFSRKYLKVGGRWRDHERWAIIAEDYKSKSENGKQRG